VHHLRDGEQADKPEVADDTPSLQAREFFVCYRDGTSQDVAEMAHQLQLGMPF